MPLEALHPAATVVPYPFRLLAGKRVALGLTGSIASVKGVELARELARHGAEVICLMSEPACKIIGTQAMEFATGRSPITEIAGQVEHVTLARPGGCDLYLIAPCTATTLARIAFGLGEGPVALAALALLGASHKEGVTVLKDGQPVAPDPAGNEPGDPPVLLALSMDGSMAAHPVVKQNLALAKSLGCHIIPSLMEEGKAKLPGIETLVAHSLRHGGPRDWEGRKVLVVAGSSSETVDGVRVLTNRSSGRTGIALALALFDRGAEVELWYGDSPTPVPEHLLALRFSSVNDVVGLAEQTATSCVGAHWDWVFVPAALADFVVEGAKAAAKTKIDSHEAERPEIVLAPAPRLLETLRPLARKLVGFKLEVGMTKKELIDRAKAKLQPDGPCDHVVANLAGKALGGEQTEVILVGGTEKGIIAELNGPKMAVAHGLLEILGDS